MSSREVIQTLRKAGFAIVDTKRGKGSHQFLYRADPASAVTVPRADPLKRGTLRAIIKQAGLSVEEFLELRK